MSQSQPDPDAILADEIARFEFDPLGYVLYVFDWGQGDLADEEGPDEWQADMLREIGEAMRTSETSVRMAVASGHGIGKTALTAWVIHWFIATRPGCAGVVTANTADQLKNKTWRELSKWNTRAINGHWFDWTATSFKSVERPDTWFIAAQPWSKERSEAFAGLHEKDVLVLFDEASAIDDVIWEVAEGAMTEKGALWLALGNPTRGSGRFKECWGKFRNYWRTKQIDSRTAKRTNKAEIAQYETIYGADSDFFRVRVRGMWPRASSMQFIASDVVEAANVFGGIQTKFDVRAVLVAAAFQRQPPLPPGLRWRARLRDRLRVQAVGEFAVAGLVAAAVSLGEEETVETGLFGGRGRPQTADRFDRRGIHASRQLVVEPVASEGCGGRQETLAPQLFLCRCGRVGSRFQVVAPLARLRMAGERRDRLAVVARLGDELIQSVGVAVAADHQHIDARQIRLAGTGGERAVLPRQERALPDRLQERRGDAGRRRGRARQLRREDVETEPRRGGSGGGGVQELTAGETGHEIVRSGGGRPRMYRLRNRAVQSARDAVASTSRRRAARVRRT